MQIAAKAYPTFRELYLAQMMGPQGVVSSLCPIHTTEQGTGDPLYGYRPAMAAIIARLQTSLLGQCLPHELTVKDGAVQCLVLASLPSTAASCDASAGLSTAAPQVVAEAAQSLAGTDDAPLLDPTQHTICQMAQLPTGDAGTCTTSTDAGWCYVEQAAVAGQCPDTIDFSPSAQPQPGVHTLLSCLESTPTVTN
ncbi:MAG TPA: hypothetical protein VGG39_03925 [Polyangiaceae bacterium]|jgi:hypothetical protein